MSEIAFGPVAYDPRTGSYEARVDIRRNGRTFRYPCRVAGQVSADPAVIRAGLLRQALAMSDSPC